MNESLLNHTSLILAKDKGSKTHALVQKDEMRTHGRKTEQRDKYLLLRDTLGDISKRNVTQIIFRKQILQRY